MPSPERTRLRLIRLTEQPVTRRQLLNRFNKRDRPQAETELGKLLSEAVLVSTGLARRGSPEMISKGVTQLTKCPMCLRNI